MLIKYDVEQTPELRLHSFAIKKQGAPTLRLAADTEEAAARWTTVIKEAIERNDQVNVTSRSPSYSRRLFPDHARRVNEVYIVYEYLTRTFRSSSSECDLIFNWCGNRHTYIMYFLLRDLSLAMVYSEIREN